MLSPTGTHRAIALWLCILGVASLLALAPPAEAQDDFPVWDTAWELPNRATIDEAETYMAYIASRGYEGIWMSYLNQSGIDATDRYGDVAASLDEDDQFVLDPAHTKRTLAILDLAHEYGLDVIMVAAWGAVYLNEVIDQDGICKLNKGVLDRTNAYGLGYELGDKIGSHPAISMWMLGGDNWCDGDSDAEDKRVWINMKEGMRDAGSMQPTGFHTAGWRAAILKFIDEPWIDVWAVQTSHCRTAEEATKIMAAAMDRTDKPVIAAEMRYEAIEPPWCDDPETDAGPDRPVTADAILADAKAVKELGTWGYVYGHNERWVWGGGDLGSTGRGFRSVQNSFFAPGEQLILDLFGQGDLPPLFCNGRQATIIGNDENNTLIGTQGVDVVVGLDGNDTIKGLGAGDIVCGGDGNDRLEGGGGEDVLLGDAGDDLILGGPGSDALLRGGSGNDRITGSGGNDTIYGDAGDDNLRGSGGNDVIWGGSGADTLKGGAGHDILEGDSGDDSLSGGKGNDELRGGTDNDKVVGGQGKDKCAGGFGTADRLHKSCEYKS